MTEDRGHVWFRRFAWGFLAYTLAVILWGTFVRATGSGAGCGAHWPMCNGELVPRAPAVETIIELTHRVTSGLAWILALALVVWSRRVFERGHGVRKGAALVLLLMTTEALVGAGLVLFEMVADNESVGRAGWMAAHLVNTFLLLAAMVGTAWRASVQGTLRLRGHGTLGAMLGIALAGVLLLGTSGAVAALGDTLFPARSLAEGFRQELSASAHLFVRLRVLHPVIGLAVGAWVLFTAGLAASTRPRPAVRRFALAVAVTYAAQVGLGFLNVALLAPVWMQLVHLFVADVLWLGLVLLTMTVLAERPEPAASPAPAEETRPA